MAKRINQLIIPTKQLEQIFSHAREGAPHEVCGIVAGAGNVVKQVYPTRNVADDRTRHYVIDPQDLATLLPTIEQNRMELIGFYHSHPNGGFIPSVTDIRQATYPDCVYLIVRLKNNQPELAAWQIIYGQVKRVFISPYEYDTHEIEMSDELTSQSRNAVLIAAFIAVVIVIVVAVMLLPPPPVIP